jgi:hypothetical protein
MKALLTIIACLSLFIVEAQSEKIKGGPKGGRLLTVGADRAEFLVESGGLPTITFYDANMKVVSPGERTVTLFAEAKSGKVKIDFEAKGDTLIGKKKLPEGNPYNLVLQFRANPSAKPTNARVNYNTEICPKCKRPEYACICDEEEN